MGTAAGRSTEGGLVYCFKAVVLTVWGQREAGENYGLSEKCPKRCRRFQRIHRQRQSTAKDCNSYPWVKRMVWLQIPPGGRGQGQSPWVHRSLGESLPSLNPYVFPGEQLSTQSSYSIVWRSTEMVLVKVLGSEVTQR